MPALGVQVTQHGACLGLGLAGLGTNDAELFEELKNVLYTDSAIAGEAAGLGLGLLAVGSATDKAAELLAYAHDTQHEKVRCEGGRTLPCIKQVHGLAELRASLCRPSLMPATGMIDLILPVEA